VKKFRYLHFFEDQCFDVVVGEDLVRGKRLCEAANLQNGAGGSIRQILHLEAVILQKIKSFLLFGAQTQTLGPALMYSTICWPSNSRVISPRYIPNGIGNGWPKG
jgi:hypothetical protein